MKTAVYFIGVATAAALAVTGFPHLIATSKTIPNHCRDSSGICGDGRSGNTSGSTSGGTSGDTTSGGTSGDTTSGGTSGSTSGV